MNERIDIEPVDETINVELSVEENIDAHLQDINYIPGYEEAEKERRDNEIVREQNETIREQNETVRQDYYENFQKKVSTMFTKIWEENKASYFGYAIKTIDFNELNINLEDYDYFLFYMINSTTYQPSGEFHMINRKANDGINSHSVISGLFNYQSVGKTYQIAVTRDVVINLQNNQIIVRNLYYTPLNPPESETETSLKNIAQRFIPSEIYGVKFNFGDSNE